MVSDTARKINWRPFRPVIVLHVLKVISAEIISYDERGRLHPHIMSMVSSLPVLIWAKIRLINGDHYRGMGEIEFGMNENGYVFGWPGKRLSSLPEHEYYWRDTVWLTIDDRDFIFEEFTKGMF